MRAMLDLLPATFPPTFNARFLSDKGTQRVQRGIFERLCADSVSTRDRLGDLRVFAA